MKVATESVTLRSFDGGVRLAAHRCRPDRAAFWDDEDRDTVRIARGAGLSYAAASFGVDVISTDHRSFNRILGFDPDTGVLEVEAGISLGKVHEFLASRGFYLAVQPGHPSITIGGCIAADVHGKHQARDGTFENQVLGLRLFHPDHGAIDVSREQQPELFELTCGGYGLCGDILTATIRAARVPSSHVDVVVRPLAGLEALPEALRSASADTDQLYSWHDCTARGAGFGRGFVIEGRWSNHAPSAATATRDHRHLDPNRRGWPFACFNRLTVRPFNAVYRRILARQEKPRRIPLFDFLFPVHDKTVYFGLFGRRGFHEVQVIVPFAAFGTFVAKLRAAIERSRARITLASAKLFAGNRQLLRFTGEGICLALNFPRSGKSASFAAELDAIVIDCGGWPNLIKDSRLPLAIVRATYPEYEQFRDRLHAFDPKRLYRSELSDRLAL